MAFRYVDSFDMYEQDFNLFYRWQGVNSGHFTVSTTGGRYGQGGLVYGDLSGGYLHRIFIEQAEEVDGNTVCIGFHFKTDADQQLTQTRYLLALANSGCPPASIGAASVGMRIGISSGDGTLFVDDFGSSTARGSNTRITDGNWHWIEVRLKAHQTEGIQQIYIDGALELNRVNVDTLFTANDTQGKYSLSQIAMQSGTGFQTPARIDDLVIWDDTAAPGDKDASVDFPIGISQIELLYPTGAGTNTQWTPSQGQNFECVNEPVPNETDFVTTTVPGEVDTYAFGNMVNNPATIHTVAVQIHAKDNISTGTDVQGVAYQFPDTALGLARTFTPTYLTKTSSVAQQAAGGAWTPSAINLAEFGVRKP